MNPSELLSTLLTSVGFRLPILITLGIALVMVLDTPRGKVRAVALWGLALLLVAALMGGLLSALPLLLIAGGNFQAVSMMNMLLGASHLALSLVQAVGYILLAWALVQALRRPLPPAKP